MKKRKQKKWTTFELHFLERHYLEKSRASMARSLKRSKPSVACKIDDLKLGTYKRPERNYWTKDQVELLRKLYRDRRNSLEFIASAVNHNAKAIVKKASSLQFERRKPLIKWTEEIHAYVKINYLKKTAKEIGIHLGLTKKEVGHIAYKMGLRKPTAVRKYTEEEVQYIITNYKKIPTRKIAEHLKRSVDGIIAQASKLGLAEKKIKIK